MCFHTLCTNDTLAIAKGLKGTGLFEVLLEVLLLLFSI